MIAVLFLCLAQEPSALMELEPGQSAVGQPVQVTVRIKVRTDGGSEARVQRESITPALDDSWVLLEEPQVLSLVRGAERVTTATWSVMSLESGDRVLPALVVRFDGAPPLQVAGARLSVRGQLEEGEDAPRPLPQLHSVSERTGPLRPRHLGLSLLALSLLGLGWWVWRRRRAPAVALLPSPAERFDEIRREFAEDRLQLQELAFLLAGLLREAADERIGERRVGLADEEWLAALRRSGGVQENEAAGLSDLLGSCAQIKFAGARPTRFAIDELIERSDRLLLALSVDPAAEARGERVA